MVFAYRFLPLDTNGEPRAESQVILMSESELKVGDRVEARMRGYETWEIIERRSGIAVGASDVLAATDASGRDVPLSGTLACRGVD